MGHESRPDSNVPANAKVLRSRDALRDARMSNRPSAIERLDNPEAVLSRSDLRELGYERSAIDAVFRSCPVVYLPGYSRLQYSSRCSSAA